VRRRRLEALPDDALVAKARSGGRDHIPAFTTFYRRHSRSVLGFFAARVDGSETVADLTAETFARALAGLDRYDADLGVPRAWLYGIARNVLREHERHEHRARAVQMRVALGLSEPDPAALAEIDRVVDRLAAQPLLDAVDDLPDRQASVLRLRVEDGASTAAIAEEMGVEPGNARVLLHRAVVNLRRLTGDGGGR
jgi:RNA polymerase sigma-70 factor (ECF subfamily)